MIVALKSLRPFLVLAAAVALYALVVPVVRACLHLEVGYNEGWNLYNALTVLHHQPLYAEGFGWHTVNYPALSFYLSAWLSHVTGEILYTGRALSLLGLVLSGVLLGAITFFLTKHRAAAVFAGVMAVSLMACTAPNYMGQYDPQIFAQTLFLAALYVYVRWRMRRVAVMASALLFVLAGNFKHNLIDIPLAVMLDLLLVAVAWGPSASQQYRGGWVRRASPLLLFLGVAIPATVLSLLLNRHFGGPAFFTNLLAGRGYSLTHAWWNAVGALGPLIPLLVVALWTAWRVRSDARQRIAALLFVCALGLNLFFAGGVGVATNALFDTLLALALLLGLAFEKFAKQPSMRPAIYAMAVWPLLPLLITNETSMPIRDVRGLYERQAAYEQSLRFMQQHEGPAICESLLLCAQAGKSYLYDPFNATRFIQLGKLDPEPLLVGLRRKQFAVIQLNKPIAETAEDVDANRFTPDMLQEIAMNYHPALTLKGEVLFLPNP